MSDDALRDPYASSRAPQARRRRAAGLGRSAARCSPGRPGWEWYLDGPILVLLALAGGYAAGAWLPGARQRRSGAALPIGALVLVNQLHGAGYHRVDDVVFFLRVVGGAAGAGAAVGAPGRGRSTAWNGWRRS